MGRFIHWWNNLDNHERGQIRFWIEAVVFAVCLGLAVDILLKL